MASKISQMHALALTSGSQLGSNTIEPVLYSFSCPEPTERDEDSDKDKDKLN